MRDAANICLHLLTYADNSLRGLSDDHLALAAESNEKTAGWIIGHLCVTGDFIRRKCGRPPLTPREWGPKFTIGSHPPRARADYPAMEELTKAFTAVYTDLAQLAPSLSAEQLSAPSPFEPGRGRFPTLREFMTWVMTGHLGYHIGQLYGWRASVGLRDSTPEP